MCLKTSCYILILENFESHSFHFHIRKYSVLVALVHQRTVTWTDTTKWAYSMPYPWRSRWPCTLWGAPGANVCMFLCYPSAMVSSDVTGIPKSCLRVWRISWNSIYIEHIREQKRSKLQTTAARRCKACIDITHSNYVVVRSNPTRDMEVCARLFCLCCPVCRIRPCDRPIPPPKERYQL
jgi:hypothetical protein